MFGHILASIDKQNIYGSIRNENIKLSYIVFLGETLTGGVMCPVNPFDLSTHGCNPDIKKFQVGALKRY